nr:integrase, catalytic region, zinc finger, CCHC-type, peptidase aspartic, catalytic [Tanacetum cinerariifolium]
MPTSPVHDRYKTGEGYHAIPPPYTGTFMPFKLDLVFHDAPAASETVTNVLNVKPSTTKPTKDMSQSRRPCVPIIEDWVSDSEDEFEVKHPTQAENLRKDILKSRGHKHSWNRKACFVCKSVNYLIKDCDYYEKKMVQKPVSNHAMRVNHQNSARMTHPHSKKHVVPTSVLTRAERLARTANPLALVAQQQPVYHPQNHPTHYTQNSSTRSQQAATRNRGKAIVNSPLPIYDQEPTMVTEDDEMSNDKEIDKLMALISLSFKKLYKPTNNNLELHQTPVEQIKIIIQGLAEALEVNPDAADNSGPIFDSEPLQKVPNNDNYNVFAIESAHPKQSKSVNDTYPIEQDEHNVIIDSLDMSYDREQVNQDDDDLANEQLDKYHDVKYASKMEIDCAKAKGDLMSYKMESEKSFNEYTRKINDLNQTISEMNKELFAHQETISIMTKMPMTVPISTREPKRIVNQSVATPLRRTVASESTNQNPRHTTRKLVEIILFIVDSGCSKHITGNLKLLTNFVEKFLGTVKFRNDQIAPIIGYGDLVQGTVTIKRVYYVKGPNHNLFSVGQFCDADLEVAFRKYTCYIRDLKGNDLLLVIVDDYSRYIWTHFLRSKDETPKVLNEFLRLVQRGLHAQVRIVRTDKGTEFLNKTLYAYFASEGILHQTPVARTPKQNSVVERRNRTLVGAARTMLSTAKNMALEHVILSPAIQCQANVPQANRTVITSNELDLLFSPIFDELLNGSFKVVSKSSAVCSANAPNQRQQHTTPLNNHTKPAPTYDEFINIFGTSIQNQGDTSSRHVDSSNMHTFYQRYPSEHCWIKDHPLEQVIGNPSQSVRTRHQLESDAEMCMFALTVSQTEPKNIKEVMVDSAWIESMQEELH